MWAEITLQISASKKITLESHNPPIISCNLASQSSETQAEPLSTQPIQNLFCCTSLSSYVIHNWHWQSEPNKKINWSLNNKKICRQSDCGIASSRLLAQRFQVRSIRQFLPIAQLAKRSFATETIVFKKSNLCM